jgi:hypothetical protein
LELVPLIPLFVAGVNAKDGLTWIVVTVKNAGAGFAPFFIAFLGNGREHLRFLADREANAFHG